MWGNKWQGKIFTPVSLNSASHPTCNSDPRVLGCVSLLPGLPHLSSCFFCAFAVRLKHEGLPPSPFLPPSPSLSLSVTSLQIYFFPLEFSGEAESEGVLPEVQPVSEGHTRSEPWKSRKRATVLLGQWGCSDSSSALFQQLERGKYNLVMPVAL